MVLSSFALILVVLLQGCSGATTRPDPRQSGAPQQSAAQSQRPTGPKRITLALKDDVPGLSEKVRIGPGGGIWIAEEIVNAGLGIIDGNGTIQPQNAEQIPSIENGLWKVNPDGTMETTWKIKPGVKWHDGTPFTSADLLFTATLERDPQVPFAGRNVGWAAVDTVEAPDAQTVVVKWKQPYIDADMLFGRRFGMPAAKHRLEQAYAENNAAILTNPYWTTEFVGTGPFRLKEFVQATHIIVTANDDYVLGRPKLDEIEIRLITDGNALVANILSGAVNLHIGPGLAIEQGVEVRNQWREGRMEPAPANWLVIHPQLLNPTPSVVGNLQFRRALLHAVDRQQLVDVLQFGLTSVAHSFLHPNQPQNREIEAQLPRYEYDPRRAEQMIADLGYTRGSDGFFRDAAGERLSVELRSTAQVDIQAAAQLAVADSWQRVGVSVDQMMIPVQRIREAPFRATFPAFELLNGPPNGEEGLGSLHSSRTRLPENNFIGSNYSRYQNPEFDALLDRYFTTIPKPERIRALGLVIHHIAENLNEMGLIHVARPVLISNRLAGAGASPSTLSSEAWNAHLWDVK
jgi:peptide/nickel transport system substrate-binding protein